MNGSFLSLNGRMAQNNLDYMGIEWGSILERLGERLLFSLPQASRKTRLDRQNKKSPAGNTPDGAAVNSVLYGPVCRYRQTPSFQILIS